MIKIDRRLIYIFPDTGGMIVKGQKVLYSKPVKKQKAEDGSDLKYNNVMDIIEDSEAAKNKISECADSINSLILTLDEHQLKQFYIAEQKIDDYHTYINKELYNYCRKR